MPKVTGLTQKDLPVTPKSDISTKAVVTGPDGFYYSEAYEWKGVNATMLDHFNNVLKKTTAYLTKAQKENDNEDDGLVATMDATVNGQALPQVVIQGFSYKELTKYQRFWAGVYSDTVSKGEEHAKVRKSKHNR